MSARILVIDDEPNVRTMVKMALEQSGHEVLTAHDGPSGLESYGDGSSVDLVLLDQKMPGMQGIEVQKEIYRRNLDAKLILITAHGTMDLALEAIHAGASDFLRKPFKTETLRTAVQSALDKPVERDAAVPVGLVCREFTRTTINGFSFDLESGAEGDHNREYVCNFNVSHAGENVHSVKVILAPIAMELARAYTDTENLPGGLRFWQAMCEEALASYLWENAQLPRENRLLISDLNPGLKTWLDSVMTVCPL